MRVAERRKVRVLAVDDSALVREVMIGTLGRSGLFDVAVAADPIIAMQKIARARPDVILLDLTMPRMDGMSFLRLLMRDDPMPVVICSAMDATDVAMCALREGAVDVVRKPRTGVRGFFEESMTRLADVLLAAAAADVRPLLARTIPRAVVPRAYPTFGDSIIAIGASTGGTEALHTILESMPENAPPIVIVQHMPEGFTDAFARHLDRTTRLVVKEAARGDRLVRGRALVAPGNRHLVVRHDRDGLHVDVIDSPAVSRHRPSVDVLFDSVARSCASSAVGVLLTGMGDDGASGLLAMKQSGARTIAQDRATSVVFGMAREAIARGAVDDVLPLHAIAKKILQSVSLETKP